MVRKPPTPSGPDPAALPGGRTQLKWPSLAERQRFEAIMAQAEARYGKTLKEEYGETGSAIRERSLLCYLNDLLAAQEDPESARPRGN